MGRLGGVSEWSKETVLKTVGSFWASWVRIPPPPPVPCADNLERWPSGRRRSPAKRVRGFKPLRGFKSLPLRKRSTVTQIEARLRHIDMITAHRVMDNEEIYRKYSVELTRYATTLVGPFDAPDVVTDACLKAFESRRWAQVTNPRAYLYKAVLSVAVDEHRRTLARRLREIRTADRETVQPVEVDVDVLAALDQLTVRQRAAVYLTYWEDLGPEAVASRMGISVGAVKRHLARGRSKLGEILS